MKRLFLVTRARGRNWDPSQRMNCQKQWPAHATFMDDLETNRFIILGGPVGNEEKILLVVDATDDREIRTTLADDPWTKSGILEIQSIEPWTILLQAGPQIRVLPPPAKKLGGA